jgi:hypothetical protein
MIPPPVGCHFWAASIAAPRSPIYNKFNKNNKYKFFAKPTTGLTLPPDQNRENRFYRAG